MLARKIYDEASVDPGGGRINPNFLAGQGATDYAWTHGVVVVTDSHLITEAARARWQSWCREVQEYEDRHPRKPSGEPNPWLRRPPIPLSTIIERLMGPNDDKDKAANPATATPDTDLADTKQAKGEKTVDGQLPQVKVEDAGEGSSASPKVESASQKPDESQSSAAAKMAFDGEDNISDTVGAIAIDKYGNIAAGSSSGGMAMKPRGRVGPAALIGIGTHVIPVDPTDPEHTTVAAVTSGTGEQLATTFAASTCASRIYYSQKMGNAGVFEQVTEEEALSSTIQREFLRKCHSTMIDMSES